METIGVLEGKNGSEKLEVLVDHDQKNGGQIHLRLLSWGEGIGWYPQKTVEIDCRQIDALQSHLRYAEALLKQNRAKEAKQAAPLLPFSLKQSSTKQSQKPPSFRKAG
jgi:hypothetical protein